MKLHEFTGTSGPIFINIEKIIALRSAPNPGIVNIDVQGTPIATYFILGDLYTIVADINQCQRVA